jgi:hypothetical protein
MHLYPHSAEIQNLWLWLVMGLSLMSKASLAVVFAREGTSINPMTQRKRYAWVLLGVVVSFTPLVVYVSIYGPELIYNEVSSWPGRFDGVGYMGVGIVLLGAVSPAWGLIDAFHIYRHPSIRAKLVRFGPRDKRGYYYTQDIRTCKLPYIAYRGPWMGDRELVPAEPLPEISWLNNKKQPLYLLPPR